MQYTYFDNLISEFNTWSKYPLIKLHHVNSKHICISISGDLPFSINESEYNFMKDCILKNKLKCGFELSTGTGISTLALSEGLIDGELITLDSYYEDIKQVSGNDIIPIEYQRQDIERIKNESKCFNFVKEMINRRNIKNVNQVIGWSPKSTEILLKDKSVDLVFLDCPKSDSDLKRDLSAISKYLNPDKFLIFIHDTHTYTGESFNYIQNLLGLTMDVKHKYYIGTQFESFRYFGLGIINKNCTLV